MEIFIPGFPSFSHWELRLLAQISKPHGVVIWRRSRSRPSLQHTWTLLDTCGLWKQQESFYRSFEQRVQIIKLQQSSVWKAETRELSRSVADVCKYLWVRPEIRRWELVGCRSQHIVFCSVPSVTTFTQALKMQEQERDRVGEETSLTANSDCYKHRHQPSSIPGKESQLSWERRFGAGNEMGSTHFSAGFCKRQCFPAQRIPLGMSIASVNKPLKHIPSHYNSMPPKEWNLLSN